MLLRITAENQDANIRSLGANHRKRVDTALARHGQIHNQNVELDIADKIDGFATATGFADNPQINLVRKKLPEARTNDGMVVHNSNFDHVAVFLGNLQRQAHAMVKDAHSVIRIVFECLLLTKNSKKY